MLSSPQIWSKDQRPRAGKSAPSQPGPQSLMSVLTSKSPSLSCKAGPSAASASHPDVRRARVPMPSTRPAGRPLFAPPQASDASLRGGPLTCPAPASSPGSTPPAPASRNGASCAPVPVPTPHAPGAPPRPPRPLRASPPRKPGRLSERVSGAGRLSARGDALPATPWHVAVAKQALGCPAPP